VLVPRIHFAFPLVVDNYVLQLPIATLGETTSALRVFLKGPVVLMGEIDCPSTERVELVRGCLITQAVWDEPP
jgi:hypothetical protein